MNINTNNNNDREITRRNGFLGFLTTDLSQFKIVTLSIISIIIPKLIDTGDRSLDTQIIALINLLIAIFGYYMLYIYRLSLSSWLSECKYLLFYYSIKDTIKGILFVGLPTYWMYNYGSAYITEYIMSSYFSYISTPVILKVLATVIDKISIGIVFAFCFAKWNAQSTIKYVFDINPKDINFYYLSFRVFNRHITEQQFKFSLTITDPLEIDCLHQFVEKNIISQFGVKTETAITKEYRLSQTVNHDGKFNYENGYVDTIQNKRMTYQLIPLYRYGRYIEDCVYVSASISSPHEVKLYFDDRNAVEKFIEMIVDKHLKLTNPIMPQDMLADIKTKYHTGRICRVFKADRLNNGQGIIKMMPSDVNNMVSVHATFDTLFYPDKIKLITTLEKFRDHKLYPESFSHMPNNLGIMFYGPPGTGKTGSIQAIANLLGRDIHEINLRRCKNRYELECLLKEVEYSKKIVVFDEFDCMAGILKTRKQIEQNATTMQTMEDMQLTSALQRGEDINKVLEKIRSDRSAEEQKIDLQWFLTWFDGTCKHQDKIVIASTNHIENLDPALMRSGRFGLRIHLHNCDVSMYKQLIYFSYKNKLSDGDIELIENHKYPLYKWAPRDLIELIQLTYGLGIENLLKCIDEDNPMTPYNSMTIQQTVAPVE